jgi:CSLREA domain-containing protein
MRVYPCFRIGSAVYRLAVSLALATAAIGTVDARLAPPRTAQAAGYLVNSTIDGGDGICDGTCTLRDAIAEANSSAGADTITFDVSGTIVLTSTLPTISQDLTIDGSGQTVIVDGANGYRLFFATAPVTLTALTVQNGWANSPGAGAYFQSTTAIAGVTFISNDSSNGGGGGAYFNSAALLTDTVFISNTADSGGGGGGAHFHGPATIVGGTFAQNWSFGHGGGAFFDSTAAMTGTTFISNTAFSYGGGGAYIMGSATITNSTFTGNTAIVFGSGGGVLLAGLATVTGATFTDNKAPDGHGGAAFVGGDNSVVQDSLFKGNTAMSLGGGLFIASAVGVSLRANRILDNESNNGGGLALYSGAQASLDNTVLAANTVTTPGNPAEISLNGEGAMLTGRHNTFASASAGSGTAMIAGSDAGEQTLSLVNSILSGYAVGVEAGSFSPTITLNGVLWSGVTAPTQGAGISVAHAHTGNAAFVDAGANDYHLGTSSAARELGVSTSLKVDFEGDPRPIGPNPDLGADEYREATPMAPVAVDDAGSTPEDIPVLLNVLANDSDVNGDSLSVSAVGTPSDGAAVISGTLLIRYTPALHFIGQSVFTYTISDGALTDTATVTVTVFEQHRLCLPIIRR